MNSSAGSVGRSKTRADRSTVPALPPHLARRSSNLTIGAFEGEKTPCMYTNRQVGRRDSESFFAQTPVFTLTQFAAALGITPPRARERVKYHLERGRLRNVERGLYAVVPVGQSAERFEPDRYLVAATARPDPSSPITRRWSSRDSRTATGASARSSRPGGAARSFWERWRFASWDIRRFWRAVDMNSSRLATWSVTAGRFS